jgi:hypothetical protein
MKELIRLENRKENFYAYPRDPKAKETLGIEVSGNTLENSPEIETFVNEKGYTKIIVTSLKGFSIALDFLENCPNVRDLELPFSETRIDGLDIYAYEDDRLQSLFKNPYFKVHVRLF